jgi:hypothetical protein
MHLLHELAADVRHQCRSARAGDEQPYCLAPDVRERGRDGLEKRERLLRLARLVALVVLPEDCVVGGIHHYRLDRGRADIKTDQ